MRIPVLLPIALSALIVMAPPARAQDARAIATEAQKRTESKSQRYIGLLQSFDENGKTSEKRWTYERLGAHGQSKSIIRFTEPAEVRGVALLVVNHLDRASDQWMWTPAIERDRRIAMQDRSTRFFGTDFTFEDLEEREVGQFDYSLLGEETVDGLVCWKIESKPKQSRISQYTRGIYWIRKDNYAYHRIDLYVRDEIVRRVAYRKVSQVQGIWTALETTVTDMKRGTLTRLALDKVEYNIPLNEGDLTLQALRR